MTFASRARAIARRSPARSKREYNKLLADLRCIIREGKEEAERAATQAFIESYWAVGRRIAREKLNERAGYHPDRGAHNAARRTCRTAAAS